MGQQWDSSGTAVGRLAVSRCFSTSGDVQLEKWHSSGMSSRTAVGQWDSSGTAMGQQWDSSGTAVGEQWHSSGTAVEQQ